jgi:undecaprenyl-diphosphatase
MQLLDWVSAIVLGALEGLTEFIPVSSTGHLLLAEQWLSRQSDLFNIVIQSAAVIAVIPLFRERCRTMFAGWRAPAAKNYLLKVLAAFAITGAGGLALEATHFKLPEDAFPVAMALIVGGVLFVVVEQYLKGRARFISEVTWTMVIAVGLGQLIAAVFPGTSRSGATIILTLLMGLSRPAATEFSFLVGIPTMLSAGALKILQALRHEAAPENWGLVIVGSAVSAIVSFIAVRWLLRYVQRHTFTAFGWYRIVLGAFILAYIHFGVLK